MKNVMGLFAGTGCPLTEAVVYHYFSLTIACCTVCCWDILWYVIWCGAVWYGVMWCWCGVVWCGLVCLSAVGVGVCIATVYHHITGASMGGLHSAMTASLTPFPVGMVSWLGPPSAVNVFTKVRYCQCASIVCASTLCVPCMCSAVGVYIYVHLLTLNTHDVHDSFSPPPPLAHPDDPPSLLPSP